MPPKKKARKVAASAQASASGTPAAGSPANTQKTEKPPALASASGTPAGPSPANPRKTEWLPAQASASGTPAAGSPPRPKAIKKNNQDDRPYTRQEYGDIWLGITPKRYRTTVTETMEVTDDESQGNPNTPTPKGRHTRSTGSKKRKKKEIEVEVETIPSPEYAEVPNTAFSVPSALPSTATAILKVGGLTETEAAEVIRSTEEHFLGDNADVRWALLRHGKYRNVAQPHIQGVIYWTRAVMEEMFFHHSVVWRTPLWGGKAENVMKTADRYLGCVIKEWKEKVKQTDQKRSAQSTKTAGVETSEEKKLRLLGEGSSLLDTESVNSKVAITFVGRSKTSQASRQPFEYKQHWIWSETEDSSGRAMRAALRRFYQAPNAVAFACEFVCDPTSDAAEEFGLESVNGEDPVWEGLCEDQISFDQVITNTMNYGKAVKGKSRLFFRGPVNVDEDAEPGSTVVE